jgi:hypothetical protein
MPMADHEHELAENLRWLVAWLETAHSLIIECPGIVAKTHEAKHNLAQFECGSQSLIGITNETLRHVNGEDNGKD